ncbi:MAG: rod shape-determining protein MreD [Ruminococcus sp.]|nr:rod shape-determining protein MreD [Ruminococcus sp.]
MQKKLTVLRYFSYGIEILILYILQGTPNLIPEIYGGKPVLLICTALTIAAFEKEVPALFFGLGCGVLCDLAISNTIGYFAVVLTALCYLEAIIFNSVMVKNFLNTMLYAFCSCVLVIGLYFVFFFIFKGYTDIIYYFTNHYISRIIYTFVCVFPIYFLNMFIFTQSKEKE